MWKIKNNNSNKKTLKNYKISEVKKFIGYAISRLHIVTNLYTANLYTQQQKNSKWKHSGKKDLEVMSRTTVMCRTISSGLTYV